MDTDRSDGHVDGHSPLDDDNMKLDFDKLDFDSRYSLLNWLDSVDLIKFERVSKTVKEICEGHQRSQKVIAIGSKQAMYYNTYLKKSIYGESCGDSSHDPNTITILEDIDLIPKFMNKYTNIAALYLNYNDRSVADYLNVFKEVQVLPPKLKHLHLDINMSEENLKKLVALLKHVDIKHLMFYPAIHQILTKSQLELIFQSCPNLELLSTHRSHEDLLYLLPNLTDYRTYSISMDMMKLEDKMKNQLVKLSIPNISGQQVLQTIYQMKSLKQLEIRHLSESSPFISTLDFDSITELKKMNYRIKRLIVSSSLLTNLIENIPAYRLPETKCIELDCISNPDFDAIKMADLLFQIKSLQEVRCELGFTFGKCFLQELFRRSTCFKYMIISHTNENTDGQITQLTDEEWFKSLISLVMKFPKTCFVYYCEDFCVFEDINHDFDNLILEIHSN